MDSVLRSNMWNGANVAYTDFPKEEDNKISSQYHEVYDLAEKYDMKVLSISQVGKKPNYTANLSINGKHDWILTRGSNNRFTATTCDTFLLDNLWLENLEEVLSVAENLDAVINEAASIYKCICEPASAHNSNGSDESDYEYSDNFCDVTDSDAENKQIEQKSAVVETSNDLDFTRGKSGLGTQNARLMRDLRTIRKSDTSKLGFFLELVDEDNLTHWRVKLFGFADCPLAIDMVRLENERNINYVEMEMKFPQDYPYAPPFVRVVFPRFEKNTGFIIGGAFCFELLTKQGWTPTNDIESVIVQLRSMMIAGHARIDFDESTPYDESLSHRYFRSAAALHNWPI